MPDPLFSRRELNLLEALTRRRDHLHQRFSRPAGPELSFDRREHAAICWAMQEVKQARQTSQKAKPC